MVLLSYVLFCNTINFKHINQSRDCFAFLLLLCLSFNFFPMLNENSEIPTATDTRIISLKLFQSKIGYTGSTKIVNRRLTSI